MKNINTSVLAKSVIASRLKAVAKQSPVTVFALAFLLASCGDDSSKGTEPVNDSSSSSTVSDIVTDTFADLPVCVDKREGATAYVKDEKVAYICVDGDWTPDSEDQSSASVNKESSSSVALTSSSSDKDEATSSGSDKTNSSPDEKSESSSSVMSSDSHEGASSAIESANSSASEKDISSSSVVSDSEESSSSTEKEMSSSSENSDVIDCSVKDGIKVFAPKGGELFKLGDTITVVYGSDVEGSGYRFVFKTSEDDMGMDLLDESVGPTQPDGKTCYEQKVVLKSDNVDFAESAIIRVIPYEKTSKGANSGTFKIVSRNWSWNVPKEYRFNPGVSYGTMTDSRDGQTYKTVQIGNQTWMAENLNYADSVATPSLLKRSWCFNNKVENCAVAGWLYTWPAAIDSVKLATAADNPQDCGYGKTCSLSATVRGICPDGWHLPTKTEWETLFDEVGGQSTAGKILKSQTGWYNNGNGTDAYGFSALPAGLRYYTGIFDGGGDYAYFWSATENFNQAYYMYLYSDNEDANLYAYYKDYAYSVRCLQD